MLPISIIISLTSFSWLDVIIFIVLIFYIIEGIEEGFIDSFLHASSLFLSFVIGLLMYGFFGKVLFDFGIFSYGFAFAIAFFLVAAISQCCFIVGFAHAANYIFAKKEGKTSFFPIVVFGAVPGFFSGCALLAFFIMLAVTLPLSPIIKHIVSSSVFGTVLVAQAQDGERMLRSIFGQKIDDLLTFSSLPLESTIVKELGFTVKNPVLNEESKKYAFKAVNMLRAKEGKQPLLLDNALSVIAKEHADDMLTQGYMSYYTRGGLSIIDRMAAKDIIFTFANEAIAFAPSPALAMHGFFNQQNAKTLILSKQVKRVGISVADAEMFGQMFVLDFAD